MNNLAPITVFVYNRIEHTRKTMEALQKNIYAQESDIYIYADGAMNFEDEKKVADVRQYIKNIQGFRRVTIIEQKRNKGLAQSIVDGVTDVVNKHGNIIVLEDDIVTSPYFLKFMNRALNFYKNEKKIWHISGWNYPINIDGTEDVFLWRLMNCWGWGTWKDRWMYFEKNAQELIETFDADDIRRFNLDGVEDFWNQVIDNVNKKKNTWAIFWYATIFRNNGLCLNPSQTFVENIGHDGSGTNCEMSEFFTSQLSKNANVNFVEDLVENKSVIEDIQKFYKKKRSFFTKIIHLLRKKI